MQKASEVYTGWAGELNRRGLSQPAILLLQAFTPFTYLFSQLYYFSQPLLGSMLRREQRQALITLLEDPVVYQSFTNLLNLTPDGNHD